MYGLKQSPRAWFGRFTIAMRKYGYKQSNFDHEAGIEISENPVQHEFNMIEQNTWRLSDTSLKKNWKMELLNFRSSD